MFLMGKVRASAKEVEASTEDADIVSARVATTPTQVRARSGPLRTLSYAR